MKVHFSSGQPQNDLPVLVPEIMAMLLQWHSRFATLLAAGFYEKQ